MRFNSRKQKGFTLLETMIVMLVLLPLMSIMGAYSIYNAMAGDDRTLRVLSFIENVANSNSNQATVSMDKYKFADFQQALIKDTDCARYSCLLTLPQDYPDSTTALIQYSSSIMDNKFSFTDIYLYSPYLSGVKNYPTELFNNIQHFNSSLPKNKIDELLRIRSNLKSYYAKSSDINRIITKDDCLNSQSNCVFVIHYKKWL
jgi:prepilin-type N-terminal cleavage/methylation domain-containing protein